MFINRVVSLAAIIGSLVVSTLPASAGVIVAQTPCTTSGACVSFSGGGTVPTTIRGFAFNAPGAGKAAVSFVGSMFCSAGGSTASQRVADFITQIVPAAATVPSVNGPSGNRLAMRLGPPGSDGFGLSTTFNLATTRTFVITSAGTKQYFFNLANLRMDATISCSIYDASFTAIFLP